MRAVQLIAKCGGKRRPPNKNEGAVGRLMTAIAPGVHFVKSLVEFRLVLCFYGLAKRSANAVRNCHGGRDADKLRSFSHVKTGGNRKHIERIMSRAAAASFVREARLADLVIG